MLVKPQVSLSAPVAPSVVKHGVRFTAHGYLRPRHAATASTYASGASVSQAGAWVLKKVVAAPDVNYKTWTKYKASMTLSAGKWKLMARYVGTADYALTTSTASYLTSK